MAKKLSLLMAAVAVLAFAIPAFANAAPAVTSSKNVLAPASTNTAEASTITGTSTDVVTESSLGELKCEKVTVTAWLTKNNGTEVHATTDAGAQNQAVNCTAGGIPVSITNPTITTLQANLGGSGTQTVSLDFTLPEVGCTFSGTVPFTYTSGASSLNINGNLTSNACGNASINGNFAISIGAAAVILD